MWSPTLCACPQAHDPWLVTLTGGASLNEQTALPSLPPQKTDTADTPPSGFVESLFQSLDATENNCHLRRQTPLIHYRVALWNLYSNLLMLLKIIIIIPSSAPW